MMMATRRLGLGLAAVALLAAIQPVSFGAPIHDAACDGDVQKLTALLDAKPQLVSTKDEAGMTPLHWAAMEGRKDAVALLLARGAAVNARSQSGYTALSAAAGHVPPGELSALKGWLSAQLAGTRQPDPQSYQEIVAMLLEKHADTKTRDFLGDTPLHEAAYWGHDEIVRLLCEHGADVSAKDMFGETPLHGAAGHGRLCSAQILLRYGADVNARAGRGTPLHTAAWSGNVAMVELLLDKGADVNAKDEAGVTAIYGAAVRGAVDVVKLLLERGYRVATIEDAVLIGDVERVKEFLAADPNLVNARIGSKGKDQPTVLHLAAAAGRAEVVELLLSRGANPNARAQDGATPLHQAVWGVRAEGPEVVGVLLAHGGDANARDSSGATPLHIASHGGQVEFMELLLAAGGDPNAKDKQGRTPLHEAVHTDQELLGAARSLDAAEGRHSSRRPQAILRSGQKLAIDVLLSGGANVNAKDDRGVTPLHIAAYSGYADVGDVLLARGASARVKSNDGTTPLHNVAIGDGDIPTRKHIADSLLAKGADVNAKNAAGKTPLELAKAKGKRELADLLRRAGAGQPEK
jgi:cytohesin